MSDGLSVEIVNEVSDRLAAAPDALRSGLAASAQVLADELLGIARALAGGEVLQRRSGELVESLEAKVHVGAGGVVADLSSAAPYAAILEYGGEIPAHEIRPSTAKALRFKGGAGAVFASVVRVPEVHIAEHSFLRRALDAEAAEIRRRLVDDVGHTLSIMMA